MTGIALTIGIIAGFSVGARGLVLILGLLVLSLPSLFVAIGWAAVGKALASVALIQIGYALTALAPASLHALAPRERRALRH